MMDWGEVTAYADGFARAVGHRDKELIASYVCEQKEAEVQQLLDGIAGPIKQTETLTVQPAQSTNMVSDPETYSSVIWIRGSVEEVALRTIWAESPQQLLIRAAHIVERSRAAGTSETGPQLHFEGAALTLTAPPLP